MSEPDPIRLLFVARRAPHPLVNGARIRTFHLLTGLARSFDTMFVTFEHHPDSPDGVCTRVELEQLLPGIAVATMPSARPRKRMDQAASLLRRRSWSFGRYPGPGLDALLRTSVDSFCPHIVHFDDPGVALAGPVPGTLSVYSSHNIEQRILSLGARVGSAPRRLFSDVEARKVGREERRIWRDMDLCLAVSERDRAAMIEGGARRAELCPNGVDEVQALPLRPLAPGELLRLVFVGSGNYMPYERGLAWLVTEVLPRIRPHGPIALDVVGSPPARPIEAEGVSYLGRVQTVAPYYDRAHVVVVPVFEGSGTRLKVIEAAAYGRPVVSTSIGAEGLSLVAGEDFLQADDADQFAAAILELARRWREPADDALAEMVRRARARVEPLAWGRIVDELSQLYRASLMRRLATPGAGQDLSHGQPRAGAGQVAGP